ncbi:hypothetical protein N44_00752 [Microcystis aeruginosa NIES-44]|uniref:Uncharacterized protein n=1 Tax=Microcystis aeruginosa NIES-44 TaxID=449439 RepID=A0A0A1VPJ2_MICAE|nr:hypothetical protein N44_00752 [Microcystis aeruginosa NIES-44]
MLVGLGVSPDEKIFTPTDERGFLPYTPHPTPSFKSEGEVRITE